MAAEKENIILIKSFDFAVRIVKLATYLKTKKNERNLSSQIVRSGTSIGANAEEAVGGFSYHDFAAKMGIAYKEARETRYWLRLLHATGFIDGKMFESLHKDCEEIISILSSILKTTSKRKSETKRKA